MQVNATILAAQQAAREARAQLLQPKPAPAASFLSELKNVDPAAAAPKPASAPAAAPVQQDAPQTLMRPGSLVNIIV